MNGSSAAAVAAVLASTAFTGTARSESFTIDFDHSPSGASIGNLTTINSQYVPWGVQFSANAFVGAGWATNTGMHATSTDVAAGYESRLRNVLHAYNNDWRFENGRPSFRMTFANAITSLSLDVVADTGGLDGLQTFVAFYDAAGTEIGRINASASIGVERLSWTGPAASSVAIAHGDFNDWVAIDNITCTTVPAPATLAVIAATTLRSRRRQMLRDPDCVL